MKAMINPSSTVNLSHFTLRVVPLTIKKRQIPPYPKLRRKTVSLRRPSCG